MDASSRFVSIAVFILFALAVCAPARAATIHVANCNDSGSGSLRNAAAIAMDDDVIDLRGLSCNRILVSSPIIFDQYTITLQGPGYAQLAIDGGGHSAVLRHHQFGTGGSTRLIRIRDLTVRWGFLDDPVAAYGACVYSGGSVELTGVQVHHCVARGANAIYGAGVSARRNLRLIQSQVYANRAVLASPNAYSFGGGAFGQATLLLDHSLLSRNEAQLGGGAVGGDLTVRYSTISYNIGGGMEMGGGDVGRSTFAYNDTYGLHVSTGEVANSTFSSNTGPGLIVEHGGVYWQNTIAYNTVPRIDGLCRGGFDMENAYAQLRGNLMAHNSCDGIPLDFSERDSRLYSPSSRNLIMYASGVVPPDTLIADPHLMPLANYGGPTLTHALPAGSPAINHGSGAAVGDYDQRGPGFLRRVCLYTDIGAFERQQIP